METSKLLHKIKYLPVLLFLFISSVSNAQNGDPTKLLYRHFGVELELQSLTGGAGSFAFIWDSFKPDTTKTKTADWIESDWFGTWSFSNENHTTVDHESPDSTDEDWYPSGGEPYDVEAIYFDNDEDSLYVVVVTSVPHYIDHGGGNQGVGVFDPRYGNIWVRPGDISINLYNGNPRLERHNTYWHYNYGIDLVHENRDSYTQYDGKFYSADMRDNLLGNKLYKTVYDAGGGDDDFNDYPNNTYRNPINSDWYVSVPKGATNGFWEHTNFDPQSTTSTNNGIASRFKGEVESDYYQYIFDNDSSKLENNYPTFVYEFRIPRALFGSDNPAPGDLVGIQFLEGCRNDGNEEEGSISFGSIDEDSLDFGDAPDPTYPTLLANNAAGHIIIDTVYLGTLIDAEEDGIGSANADGDDNDGTDDEDGVAFSQLFYPNDSTEISITASVSGYIDAWVDFNNDGDWDDSGEHVFASQEVNPGANSLYIQVPAYASQGNNVQSRFRYSTQGGLDYRGIANDGEVEDYLITIEETASLGDFVWLDLNEDGIQDDGEIGVQNITVLLYNDENTLIATDTTDINGAYLFEYLVPDDYYLEFTNIGAAYSISPKDNGGDDEIDSDVDPTTRKTDLYTLAALDNNLSLDMGLYTLLGSIGDYIWKDQNMNGIQDVGESPVENIRITLYDDADNMIGSPQLSNVSGNYLFSGLEHGDYYLVFSELPAGYRFSPNNQGSDDTKDSDPDTVYGQTVNFTLSPGENQIIWDAGIYDARGEVGNFVWFDENRNGIQDTGEEGLEGVEIKLYDDTDHLIDTKITNSQGEYLFDNLEPGDYYIKLTEIPSGYSVSSRDQGSDDELDSDLHSADLKTIIFTIQAQESDLSWDIGLCKPLDLGVIKEVDNAVPSKNDHVTFTMTVINNSDEITATNVQYKDTLSSNFVYISDSPSKGTYNESTGIWTIGTLNPSEIVTLEITVEVLDSDDNWIELWDLDQVDTDPTNNKDFASVSIQTASGGNDGGVESEGSLAGKIATRNYSRMKHNLQHNFDNAGQLSPFKEAYATSGLIVPHSRHKSTTDIVEYLPESGLYNTEAVITTPADLLGISNAMEVFSVDYFRNDSERLAAILALTTEPGEVYNHTKVICDRLTGANMEFVDYITVKDKKFILSKLVQASGKIDYTVSFIAYPQGSKLIVDNHWHNEEYTPGFQEFVFNFQVWGVAPDLTNNLVDQILTKLGENFELEYENADKPRIPQVFINSGYYKNGKLHLSITNNAEANQVEVSGNLATVENGDRSNFRHSISINPDKKIQNIEVPVGYIFDAGFSLANNSVSTRDALYFADGPWSKYIEGDGAIIHEFNRYPENNDADEDSYMIERSVSTNGEVKTYLSVFKTLIVGTHPVDLSNYNQIEFEASGEGYIELILAKESINRWNEQYRVGFNLSPNAENYVFNLDDFKNDDNIVPFSADDITTVIFNILGNKQDYTDYSLNVQHVKFKNGSTSKQDVFNTNNFRIYPNPVVDNALLHLELNTFTHARVEIFNVMGSDTDILFDRTLPGGQHDIPLKLETYNPGIYFIRVIYDNKTETKQITINH